MLQPRFAFVVRIWQEGRDWRGSLESSGNGETAYFASLKRLAELLSQTTGWSGEMDGPGGRGPDAQNDFQNRRKW
jgi:hypothetical protein